MGLLDNFNLEDPRTMGLLNAGLTMLGASGASRTPVNLGQILGGGLQSYTGTLDDFRKRKQQEEEMARVAKMQDLQMQQSQLGLGQLQQQIKDQESTKAFNAKLPEIVKQFGNDYQGMIRAGVPFNYVKQLAEAGDLGVPEVARTMDVAGEGGAKMTQQYDKRGNPIGSPISSYVAPQLVNTGDTARFVTPTAGQSFRMGMSPSDLRAESRFNRQMDQSERHFQAGQDKPVFNADLGGFVSPKTGFTPVSGIASKSPKMTEDQAKATGWLVQAENAWKNMQEAGTQGRDASGNFIIKESARPGFNDALAAVPSFGLTGGIANTLRGGERQKFMQSASSLSESLLRAATGAGVTKDEAAQKVAELTPQFGDSEQVIQQKMSAIPLYIESLKVRSGAGAPQAQNIFNMSGSKTAGWSIQKVD